MARSLLCLSRTRIDIPNLPPAHTFLCVRFKTLRSELGAVPITDILTKEERSALMAKVKGKNTKPEIYVRKYLFSKGFRYRVNDPRYPGRPDIILPKYRTAIFVHGCFWHGTRAANSKARLDEQRSFWRQDQNQYRAGQEKHRTAQAGRLESRRRVAMRTPESAIARGEDEAVGRRDRGRRGTDRSVVEAQTYRRTEARLM